MNRGFTDRNAAYFGDFGAVLIVPPNDTVPLLISDDRPVTKAMLHWGDVNSSRRGDSETDRVEPHQSAFHGKTILDNRQP